ncbi:hypothetical protein [Candidatus Chloroploca sp. Khr17]|uniref:hypothetical protein n=1 Tax=Candidatus Chloroploca sp. Khr17 TaxID=2496869 RepID=UPI00101CB511|nr:hypothetical protein [Candidatus Chloroploca sp. Khr17]
MSFLTILEIASYMVTIIGLPYAIVIYVHEQRLAEQRDEEAVYLALIDEYVRFQKLILEHPDLHLRMIGTAPPLNDDQQERRLIIFDILVSLFERAYILVYEEVMHPRQQRLWRSWEGYMREWCRREEFRTTLPLLLEGEDSDFAMHISRIAAQEAVRKQAG